MAPDPEGFVKLWRRLLKHPLWKSTNSNAKVLFIHILLTANWKLGKWLYESTVVDIAPGERIGSSKKIAAELGLSRQEFRHAVEILRNLEILARDATIDKGKRYTRLSLINWDRWQGIDNLEGKQSQPDLQPDCNQTSTRLQPDLNQTATTIKEGKKLRREEQPLLSDGNPPSDSTPLDLTSPEVNGRGKRKTKKLAKSETMGWPPWKLAAWQAIYAEDPKKFYAAGALEIFGEAVETEEQAAWLVKVHREQCAACPPTKWPGLCSWLKGQTEAMKSGITAEQASNGMEAF